MLYIFLYLAVFVLWVIIEMMTAPKGYEDERGFHYGTPPSRNPKENLRRTINLN